MKPCLTVLAGPGLKKWSTLILALERCNKIITVDAVSG